ncbi:PEP-CTERM sorting domain-containing protein [Aeoliella sp. ICT_H6.2]|uniref:PEP-CTERM sorting domain-containing protein n=1 Tax=Aeoliella straminimaris TaxID=2954799 RepID=A0A9X2FDH9_9BACT|nr:PEP-CTERM sorting domain-containing protein [Aeoliella straminimaris]
MASDDFSAELGGTGFNATDEWGNLENGVSTTAVASPAFRALDPALDSVGLGTVYVSFDFSTSQTVNWGGLAFFEGVDGGDETLFVGMPNGQQSYGIDLKGGQGVLLSGVPIDTQVHRIIAQIEFGSSDDTYRLWVDNLNESMPNGEITLDGFVVDDAWQSVRVASDVGAGTIVTVDNLVIADSAADVGMTPSVDATLTIDRGTGEISLSSGSNLPNVVGYTLRSNAGSFDQATWNTIDGRDATDATPPGDGSVDDNDWEVLTGADSTTDLSEFTFDVSPGDGLALGTTPLSLGTPWMRSPIEDISAVVTIDDNGTEVPLAIEVVYTGDAVVSGDLNGDGDIDLDDWVDFKAGQGVVNGGMTAVEAYRMGDLDGNFVHDLEDFDLFAEAYDLANGAGAFAAAITSVPEPSTIAMLAGVGILACTVRRRTGLFVHLVAAVFLVASLGSTAKAVVYASDDFSADGSGVGWAGGDIWETRDDGGFLSTYPNGSPDNTFSSRNFAAPIDPQNNLTYIRFDYRQGEASGQDWGGFAFFEGLDAGNDESFFAGANPGGTENYAFDTKGGGNLDSMVPFNAQYRTIIGAIDQTGANTIYSIWIDNFDVQNPNNTLTIDGQGAINAPWQSLRFNGSGTHEFADNLLITDGSEQSMIFEPPALETLNLLVDKSTGEVMIENSTGADVDISGYSITSGSGMLDAGGTPGDFNIDGAVDIADYTVWRNHLGGDAAALGGNGSGGATVTAADYELWKANFGNMATPGDGWESFAERDTPVAGFPQGSDNGLGWEAGGNPSTFEVAEYYLLGESAVGSTSLSLGPAYRGGPDGTQDLSFSYRSNGELVFGSVYYVAAGSLATSAVPEPSSLLIVCVGAAMALISRRCR